MVYVTYSQPKLKPIFKDRIISLFNLVKTRATSDLWIKVFIYRTNKYNPGCGLNRDKDWEQIEFYFGERFKWGEISKYRNWNHGYRGHYRYAEVFGHGFYDDEWKFIRSHPKIKHVITLKFSEDGSDLRIAKLIAHEYRHYLQFCKYGLAMVSYGNNGTRKRPVQVERDANKWAAKRIKNLVEEGKL